MKKIIKSQVESGYRGMYMVDLEYKVEKGGGIDVSSAFQGDGDPVVSGDGARYGAHISFIEQFLEPPIFRNYPSVWDIQNVIWIPTWCTFMKIPVIDDVDKLI